MKIRTDGNDWIIVAYWYGKDREIYRGNLYGAINYRRMML